MWATELFFWLSLTIVIYTYLGYGLTLFLWVSIRRYFQKDALGAPERNQTDVTILIIAYNQKDEVNQKLLDNFALDYPHQKLHQIWVTDGSNDGTEQLLRKFKTIKVLHDPEHRGKTAAINRAMKHVKTPIVVFSDVNTLLNEKAIKNLVVHFRDPNVGCVIGERQCYSPASGENHELCGGLYWIYESTLKRWESELNSAIGVTGELFAIRTDLFQKIESDILLEDFLISLRIAMKGYKVRHAPDAYSIEPTPSSVKDDLRQKIRFAAGGIQSVVKLLSLLNIFKYRTLSFQYISHRVFRWTIAPLLLPILLFTSALLYNKAPVYTYIFGFQVLFYLSVLWGMWLKNKGLKIRGLLVPYYFFLMNYMQYLGFLKFLQNNHNSSPEQTHKKRHDYSLTRLKQQITPLGHFTKHVSTDKG
jgi:Glycosyltransferases, probably involved in cell wall biogenesis